MNSLTKAKQREILLKNLTREVYIGRAHMRFTRYRGMYKNIGLITLQTFSSTGGIQQMTRVMANALYSIGKANNAPFFLSSLYDEDNDLVPAYLPQEQFKGFGGNRLLFIRQLLWPKNKPGLIILSHINLASVGLLIRVFNPRCKIWLVAHGIEVWRPLSIIQKLAVKCCSKVICVSNYTREQMISRHQVHADKCVVLNNALDPFMKLPENFVKPAHLLKRYDLDDHTPIVFTLTRLDAKERYKGYDQVIKAICNLKKPYPAIRYILAGSYDYAEGNAVKKLIADLDLTENVILTGYLPENELNDHFLLADVFALPSKGEGFGIVLIEALACGLPVICGNADGSMDAIDNGKLGTAIDPDNLQELEKAIENALSKPVTAVERKQLQTQALQNFNAQGYTRNLQELLTKDHQD